MFNTPSSISTYLFFYPAFSTFIAVFYLFFKGSTQAVFHTAPLLAWSLASFFPGQNHPLKLIPSSFRGYHRLKAAQQAAGTQQLWFADWRLAMRMWGSLCHSLSSQALIPAFGSKWNRCLKYRNYIPMQCSVCCQSWKPSQVPLENRKWVNNLSDVQVTR